MSWSIVVVCEAPADRETAARLTTRVGMITDELRAFSRKSTGRVVPVALEDPIAGALLLSRLR